MGVLLGAASSEGLCPLLLNPRLSFFDEDPPCFTFFSSTAAGGCNGGFLSFPVLVVVAVTLPAGGLCDGSVTGSDLPLLFRDEEPLSLLLLLVLLVLLLLASSGILLLLPLEVPALLLVLEFPEWSLS